MRAANLRVANLEIAYCESRARYMYITANVKIKARIEK